MGNNVAYLHSKISAVCPLQGVSVANWADKSTWRIDFLPTATPAERAAAQNVVDTYAEDPAALAIYLRDGRVAAEIDDVEDVVRAAVLVLLDELNLHASKIQAMLQGVAGAASLADLKTAFGAIQAIPQRTPAQLRAAIRNKLGS